MSIRVTMPWTSLGSFVLKKVIIPGVLTHFQPMFDVYRNQLSGLSIIGTLVENGLKRHF